MWCRPRSSRPDAAVTLGLLSPSSRPPRAILDLNRSPGRRDADGTRSRTGKIYYRRLRGCPYFGSSPHRRPLVRASDSSRPHPGRNRRTYPAHLTLRPQSPPDRDRARPCPSPTKPDVIDHHMTATVPSVSHPVARCDPGLHHNDLMFFANNLGLDAPGVLRARRRLRLSSRATPEIAGAGSARQLGDRAQAVTAARPASSHLGTSARS